MHAISMRAHQIIFIQIKMSLRLWQRMELGNYEGRRSRPCERSTKSSVIVECSPCTCSTPHHRSIGIFSISTNVTTKTETTTGSTGLIFITLRTYLPESRYHKSGQMLPPRNQSSRLHSMCATTITTIDTPDPSHALTVCFQSR